MTFDDRSASIQTSPELPVIQVENITVYRGNYAAVEAVSFDVMPGMDAAIVGPNGAGKSTLVHAILGLIPAATGSVQIFGRPLRRLGSLRQQIGYIPQNFLFDRTFPLSVSELVGLGWYQPGQSAVSFSWKRNPEKVEAIAQALQKVGMVDLRNQPVGTLSGGQLKRVLLAYCLVSPRRLLVLDEAFAGVDVKGEAEFYSLLNTLKHEYQWTILQISHDLDMVSRHCDRVLCLNRRLVCQGQPELTLTPQNLLNAYGAAFSRYEHHH